MEKIKSLSLADKIIILKEINKNWGKDYLYSDWSHEKVDWLKELISDEVRELGKFDLK